jgi:hypothetical protein
MSCCSTSTLNVVLVTLQNVALSPLTNLLARFFFTPRYLQRKRFSWGAARRHGTPQRSVHCGCGGRDAGESGEEEAEVGEEGQQLLAVAAAQPRVQLLVAAQPLAARGE